MSRKIFIPVMAGCLALYLQFRRVVDPGFFYTDILFKWLMVIILAIYFLVYIIRNTKEYNRSYHISCFLSSGICALFLIVFFTHYYYREHLDDSPSLIIALDDVKRKGHESLYIDFKKNGHIRMEALYKFSEKYFWGSYTKTGDTLLLNLTNDIGIGDTAILKNNTLHFSNDTVVYQLVSFYPYN